MRILVTGASGLIGIRLLEQLIVRGYDDIRILTRDKKKTASEITLPIEFYEWNPEQNIIDKNALQGVDVVIHLAGENISEGRWSEEKKKRILNSRVLSSELLMNEIKKLTTPPKKFISSSAVGIYGSTLTDEIFTSESALGQDYLAEVCKSWEKSIFNHNIPGMSTYALRTGVVLSNQGGALPKMLPPFLAGVGGKLGSGKQYLSWIHIDDLVSQFIFLIENEGKNKFYNGVSPTPVTNEDFTKTMGKVLGRPVLFPVPGMVLKAIFGEMSDILLKGQRVLPKEFMEEGFTFQYPTIEKALEALLYSSNHGEVIFKKYLWIDKSTPEVFNFFSDEANLEKITPKYLQFKTLGKSTEAISKGTFIDYKLKIHGVPVKWKTEITNFEKNKTFTDTQLSGPYTKWVHRHDFIPFKNGTLMKDEVVYKVPFGLLGRLTTGHFIKNDITNIFKYRNETIANSFDAKS